MGFLAYIWKGFKVVSMFGGFFLICYTLASFSEWVDRWRSRHNKKLKNFTLFRAGVMTEEKLKKLLDDINAGIGGKKYENVNRVKISDIVSITALPYTDGTQFTLWYKENLPVSRYKSYNQGRTGHVQNRNEFRGMY